MNRNQAGSLSLWAISWPIFIESALQVLLRTTDTLMLSKVSDEAVASVGVSNQIIMFALLTFNFIALGSTVVVTQYLGSRRTGEIEKIVASSLGVNFIFGLLMSVVVVLLGGKLLHIFNLGPGLFDMARTYLLITGGALVIQALNTVTVAIIQSHGLTRHTMMVAVGMNLLHVFGNYLFIFGPMGFPKLGVTGVAISTNVSQLIGLAINLFILVRVVRVPVRWFNLIHWDRELVSKVLQVGIPSSAVNLSYNISQIVITSFITSLGPMMLTTKIYTQNISFIIMIIAVSIGRGIQIIVGHLIGAGEREEAYKQVLRNLFRSMLITFAAVAVICFFRFPMLEMFTGSKEIIRMGSALLLLGFLLEPGRNFNIIFERSLQAAGDARFAMKSAILIMWLFSMPLMYLLGIHLGYGLYGIWAGFIIDEWVRGLVLYMRWRSRAWERKALMPCAEEVSV
ncbi:MATE family efflux transporter [Paenibacillus sp. 7124]|uniref:MATE family efflux transporter n=1 Tax=Paenibacillus apii TaxID=1850370 RepID=A0A6M1PQ75_9BACL|nr:MATE family efflux transporter [Paenibacillus apii]NGM83883.1 MATE family efflux transporter [Paenibacillus apii]